MTHSPGDSARVIPAATRSKNTVFVSCYLGVLTYLVQCLSYLCVERRPPHTHTHIHRLFPVQRSHVNTSVFPSVTLPHRVRRVTIGMCAESCAPPPVCRYGGTEAATFCCLTTLSKQLRDDGSVDAYMCAKLYHMRRPGVWQTQVGMLTSPGTGRPYMSCEPTQETVDRTAGGLVVWGVVTAAEKSCQLGSALRLCCCCLKADDCIDVALLMGLRDVG